MNRVVLLSAMFLTLHWTMVASAQEMPRAYDKENSGADVPKPPLPEFSELPAIPHLPDPFVMANG